MRREDGVRSGLVAAYPLWTRRIAVDALVVVVGLLYLQQLCAQLVSICQHGMYDPSSALPSLRN